MIETQLLVGSKGVFGSAYTSMFGSSLRIIEISQQNRAELFGASFDITSMQKTSLEFLKKHEISRVIYCAQHSNYRDLSTINIKNLFEVNGFFLLALLLSSRELGCDVTYFSSGSVYSESNEKFYESSSIKIPSDSNPYFASKIAAEYFANSIVDPSKLLILRPFFIFGLNQKEQTLVPSLIAKVRSGEEITLQGEFGLRFNPIFSRDAAQLVFSLQKRMASGVFNLSGSHVTNIKEIAELIGALLMAHPRFRVISSTSPRIVGDNTKLLELAETYSETSLEQSLTSII